MEYPVMELIVDFIFAYLATSGGIGLTCLVIIFIRMRKEHLKQLEVTMNSNEDDKPKTPPPSKKS